MTLNELYRKTKVELKKAGVDSPAFDAMCLFERAFGLDRHGLIMHGDRHADKEKTEFLETLIKRRSGGEPLQYILGKWQFMGIDLFVGAGVLIPREDTACVVQAAIDNLRGRSNLEAADLCSGTGAIAISLAKTLDCRVTAVELYDEAFFYLEKNITANNAVNVTALKADALTCCDKVLNSSLDLIISNPPYIMSSEIATLQQEVQCEPRTALDGGEDGYLFYNAIINNWTEKLKQGGILCFELGENQFETVKEKMLESEYENIGFALDLGGVKRCIYGYKK